MKAYLLEYMTWSEVAEILKRTKTVLVPCGSTEEHGYHMPLGTDTLIAYEAAKLVSERCGVPVTFPIGYGFSRSTAPFPGTLAIRFDTLRLLIEDVCRSLYTHGFRNIIILPGHLGRAHIVGLELAAYELVKAYSDVNVAVVDVAKIYKELVGDVVEDRSDMHAGEVETSIILAIRPELVKMDKAVCEHPSVPFGRIARDPRRYLKSGVMGDATKASAEKGMKILEAVIKETVELIRLVEEEH